MDRVNLMMKVNWIQKHPPSEDEGTPQYLATATQPKCPRRIVDLKHATGFQIFSRALAELMFK
jgi:hypothetical protein